MDTKEKKKICPRNLGPDARKFWKWATAYFAVPEEKMNLLEGTAINWGLFKKCERVLSEQGFVTESARGFKSRPEIQVMKNAWAGFCQGLKLLGFCEEDEEPKKVGRPPDDRWTRLRANGEYR
jgi:phage terminase small subunit